MTCNLAVVEIGQEYLDQATKLRRDRYPNSPAVTHDEVGRYALQDPDGAIAVDCFTDVESAERCAHYLTSGRFGRDLTDTFAGRLEDEDSWPEDQWCHSWVDCYGTEGIKDFTARFTERKAVTIVFTYPLSRKPRREFRSETGFTRAEIVECIRSGYRKIYAENALTGKWGIRRPIANLMIEQVEIDEDTGVVTIGIGT